MDHFCYAFLSVLCSLVVICWEIANLLALLCVCMCVCMCKCARVCVMFYCFFLSLSVWCPGSGVVLDCIDF